MDDEGMNVQRFRFRFLAPGMGRRQTLICGAAWLGDHGAITVPRLTQG
jgi:hypothetical protein